jgi:Spy/CpxP family protein refolding chaperone
MIHRRLLFLATLLALSAAGHAADPAMNGLLPLKPQVRKVIDESCVICHGEVIQGQKETRDDVDLSTDDLMRDTVHKAGKLKLVIQNGKMPHKTKLSKRLRNDTQLQERLAALRANYDANHYQDVLLNWLKDITAAKEEEKKKAE